MAGDSRSTAPDWGRIDLNLFVPLNALLIERNVTKAAERIFVTQPAMSAALAKLRRVFDDPLLVRQGRELVLTSFAESLRQPVQQLLFSARDMLTSNQHFEPKVDNRSFTLVASDYTTAVLLVPLLPRLIAEAPGVRIKIEQPKDDYIDFVRSGRCDLLFWPSHFPTPELDRFPNTALFRDEFILVAAHDNTSFDHPLTDEELARTPCVRLASITSSDDSVEPIAPIEPVLPAVATVSTSTLALELVSRTSLVTTIQRQLFEQKRESLGLREVEIATTLPELTMTMFWHPRSVRSPAHRWLRTRVQEAAAALGA
ncbi:LysR family transcriptional regulator [Lentzea sp.]|uniref:LysR family transcriptional regulator n=1 Tax=Lentzea sp. TaxID=56099 RepID=UPI002CCEC9C0|nr:LysR substrate-binding domain-containing protein [Lentzea sp.]HUQ55889.1 LysR substrate-binding domain-containing protein [Lentzea sp.]